MPTRDDGLKTKPCFRCAKPAEVAYRVRLDATKAWVFICGRCVVPAKTNNPHYAYGGTWKGSRH